MYPSSTLNKNRNIGGQYATGIFSPYIKQRIQKKCNHCNSIFEVKMYRKNASFCSISCKNIYSGKSGGSKGKGISRNKGAIRNDLIERNKNNHQTGENNPNWRGGTTTEAMRIRKSKEIENWRKKIFERDNYTCQMLGCNKSEHYLNAHHIKTFSLYPELRLDINNGICLCKVCHDKTKGKESLFENMFNKIINK